MTLSTVDQDVASLRAFNRFFTKRSGILEPFLGGTLSLTEVRILYELAQTDAMTASDLSKTLEIDPGYLSRLLKRFETSGWIQREASIKDGRQTLVSLLPAGHEAYAPLHERQQALSTAMISSLSSSQRAELSQSLATVQHLLSNPPKPEVVIRGLEVGDIGWMSEANGEFYKQVYGWSIEFEAEVAEIMIDFTRNYKPGQDRFWMATINGKRVGGIMLKKVDDQVAKLRMLYVDPAAQGHGLGRRLVSEVVAFARESGYSRLELRTESRLKIARAMYAKQGFVLEKTLPPVDKWDVQITEETWALAM